jgi:hypothetical protein
MFVKEFFFYHKKYQKYKIVFIKILLIKIGIIWESIRRLENDYKK